MNKEQTAALVLSAPIQAIIAGPGSGKTRTLVGKIRYLVDQGIPPDSIVAITFTNAAAAEISRRLNPPGEPGPILGYCGTLHGFMLRIIRDRYQELGIVWNVASPDQADKVLRRVIEITKFRGTLEEARAAVARPLPAPGRDRYSEEDRLTVAYDREMSGAGLIDFEGILNLGLAIVKSGHLDLYRYLLVDEAQDSGDKDWAIYRALPIPLKVYIGDPDQSIYGFRGANVAGFLSETSLPEAQVQTLTINYRSERSICRAAQRLIEHNKNRFDKQTVSAFESEGEVTVWSFETPLHELQAIARRIVDSKIGRDEVTGAVLFRTNADAKHAANFLESCSIPVVRKKLEELLPRDWAAARLFVGLCCNPANDTLARMWLETVLTAGDVEKIHFDALSAYQNINTFRLHLPPQISVLDVGSLMARAGLSMESVQRVRDISYGLNKDATVHDLAVALGDDLYHWEETEGEGVVVTTIHGAKGREWQHVFLAGFEQGLLPHKSCWNLKQATVNGNMLEEERRLAYVAITRAQHYLYLSYCRSREFEWEREPRKMEPSQFLREALG